MWDNTLFLPILAGAGTLQLGVVLPKFGLRG